MNDDTKLIESLRAAGDPGFDADNYLSGDFGTRQIRLLSDELGHVSGVQYETHPEFGGWAAWLPALATAEALPALMLVYNQTMPMRELERWGFVQIAARQRFIVLAVQDGNALTAVLGSLALACGRYPIDAGRIYIAGHSFGGSAAARHAICSPGSFAGVCLLGTSYTGVDSKPEDIMAATQVGLPVVSVCGTDEINGVLPLNRDPANGRGAPPRVYPDVTPPHHTVENCLAGLALWRRINRCASRDVEEDCTPRTVEERKIGARFDRTETRALFGRLHFIGEENGPDGLPSLRVAAVDNGPHCVAPTAAPIAWEFLRQFSRNRVTGLIQRDAPEKAFTSISADTVFSPRGQVVTALRLDIPDGTDLAGLLPEDIEILGFVDMNPVLHPRQATALDRTCPGQLTILTEEFLLDGTAPRYGYIDGSPGVMTLGQFTLQCRKRPGGKSLDFSRLDLDTVNLEHPKRYENGRFAREGHQAFALEGLMAFDYVCFRSSRAAAGERLPLIFYSVGSGNKNNAAGNKQILNYAAGLMSSEAFQAVYPCHIIAPWFPMPAHPPQGPEGNAQLEAYAKSTAALTRSLAETWNADLSRIYFIGTGGGALYQHLAADPTLYAAAAMLTSVFDYFADGSEIAYLKDLQRLPIYISHAASDFPCPVRRSRLAYAKLLEFGNRDVYYREYTDDELRKHGIDVSNQAGSHESPRVDLAEPGLYRWLFFHRKTQA